MGRFAGNQGNRVNILHQHIIAPDLPFSFKRGNYHTTLPRFALLSLHGGLLQLYCYAGLGRCMLRRRLGRFGLRFTRILL